MVKVRSRDSIPEAAGQRTRLEGAQVAGEVCGYHLHDFVREAAGRFVRSTHPWRRVRTEEAIDLGFASMPNDNDASREICSYGARVRGRNRLCVLMRSRT